MLANNFKFHVIVEKIKRIFCSNCTPPAQIHRHDHRTRYTRVRVCVCVNLTVLQIARIASEFSRGATRRRFATSPARIGLIFSWAQMRSFKLKREIIYPGARDIKALSLRRADERMNARYSLPHREREPAHFSLITISRLAAFLNSWAALLPIWR